MFWSWIMVSWQCKNHPLRRRRATQYIHGIDISECPRTHLGTCICPVHVIVPLVQSWKVSWLLFTSIGLGTSHLDQVPKTNVGWQANKWSSTLFILFPWAPIWMDLGHGTEARARYVHFWIIFLQTSFLIEFFKMMLSGKYLFAYIAPKQNLFS